MKKTIFYIILFTFFSLSSFAQIKKKRDLYGGVKIGVSSSMNQISCLEINNIKIDPGEERYNLGVQLGVSFFYDIDKRNFLSLDLLFQQIKNSVQANEAALNLGGSSILTLTNSRDVLLLPLLYGYNFIKEGRYRCTFFTGAQLVVPLKAKTLISCAKEDGTTFYSVDQMQPGSLDAILGFNVRIGHIFFDFRLAKGVTNISKRVEVPQRVDFSKELNVTCYDRREDDLSVSIGVVF